jgi:hypothetical protein
MMLAQRIREMLTRAILCGEDWSSVADEAAANSEENLRVSGLFVERKGLAPGFRSSDDRS